MNASTVCAVDSTQKNIYCWGSPLGGSKKTLMGNASPAYTLTGTEQIFGITMGDVAPSANGVGHLCVVLSDNNVYCTGANSKGQLGLGNTTSYPFPASGDPFQEML
jgi:alpha-tubulin suppressor-like RCC1 family protein